MKNKTIYLKDYKAPVYKVESINLEFDLYDNHTIVEQRTNYFKNPESNETNYLELYGEDLELVSIFLDGKKLNDGEYSFNDENNLILENIPDKFELSIITKIHPEINTTLMGLYVSGGKFCTQCESQGFRRMTYYLDRPDVMTEFTTKIKADKKYKYLLSNGNKIEEGELDYNRHYAIWHDPFKKPSYLFALVAGDFEYISDDFVTKSGKKVDLKIFADKHNIDKCDFAMDSLKRAMKWDENRFGLEYDLDLFMIVAIDDFNSGAMENKGLNIFNSKAILASQETTTDSEFIYVERVVAHEYFHNWTGDRVTCRDWFQLSLKEGLTVFRDSEFTADMHSRVVKRIDDVKYLRNFQFREDSGPMAHPIRPSFFEEISNFYTVTVYEKGSEVIGIYQTILGKEGFRKGMDLYFKRHDGQAVTTEDFLAAMADANKIDLSQMQTWYNQAGTPIVEVSDEYDINSKKYTLHFRQSCLPTPESSEKKPFIIPIKFGLLKESGEEIQLDNDLLLLTEYRQSFSFENIDSKPIPSLLRHFSSPVKLKYNYNHSNYSFLMKYDTDPFNKFEASQKFAKDIILDIYKSDNYKINSIFIESLETILENSDLDNAFKAEVLTIPSEIEIADMIGENVNPAKIHEIREYFVKYLAENLEDKLYQIYNNLNFNLDYSFDAESIGNRRLKNVCLTYLSYVKGGDLAFSQYKQANNMTDKLASLTCLSNINCPERQVALDMFYSEWKHDTNVIDKWFSIQATSKLENTIDLIKSLSKHELFDIKNPNKVRALYNSFANLNPAFFNRSDGEGYKLVADIVIKLDKLNPMIASRLAKSLVNWKYLEAGLANKLKGELERIKQAPNLSKDLSEVINKALV